MTSPLTGRSMALIIDGQLLVVPELRPMLREECGSGVPVRISAIELTVLRRLADGQDDATIARDLCKAQSTVRSHIANVKDKLGAENRARLCVLAERLGLLRENGDLLVAG